MAATLRLLLVEDAPDDAELVILALRQSGMDLVWERVETADGLREALAAGSWDAVLSDYTLPELDATVALEVVRKADPNLPFIVVSGTVGEEVAVAMMRAGANDYVLKQSLIRLAPALIREIREAENRRGRQTAERANAHLAAVVASSDDAIFSMTIAGALTSWNPAAERLFGWTAAEAVGRQADFLVPPDKAEELEGIVSRLRAGEDAERVETVGMHRDGLRIDVSLTISPVLDSDDRLVGISTTTRDVGQQKRAEDSLTASLTRYRRLFEAAQDGILIVDPDSRQILDANPFLTSLLGYTHEELVGKELWEIGLFRDVVSNKAEFQTLLDVGYVRYDNHPLAGKHGDQIDVEFISNTYRVGDSQVIQCNIRDITGRKRAEAAVYDSEQRYRTLVAALTSIVWNTPASGEFEAEQPGWTAFTGQSFDQLRGWGWLNAIDPDDRAHTARSWADAVQERSTYRVEHRLRRADGAYRQMSVCAVPVLAAGGAIREWVGVHTDVTEQQRAEAERVELLKRLTLQIERLPLAYLLCGPDLRYTRWNPAAERIFGFPETEVLGKQPYDVIVARDSRQRVADIFARLAAGDMSAHGTSENITKDGQTIICEWHNTPLFGPDGEFQGILSLAQDVTARKQAERSLRLAQQRLQHVLTSSPAILFTLQIKDQQIRGIIWISDNSRELLGYSPYETVGTDWWLGKIHPQDRQETISRTKESLFKNGSATHEYRFRHARGEYRWLRSDIRLIRDASGRPLEAVGSWSDITEYRQLEDQFRQTQKMDAFGQLASGVAHDFNNLLTVINGYSDLLLQSLPASDPSRESIVEIHKAGERSAGLTSQLLAFSRQQVLAPRIVNLNEVVADTDAMLRRLIGEDVRLTTTLATSLWLVRCDVGQIEQVLLNLAVNARDAMPGGGRLTIETQNIELDEAYVLAQTGARRGPHVLLSVADTGTGMSREVSARIFEPFFTTKAPGKGTGLGLATVYGIVKQSGGHLALHTEVGVGTTFKVYLPRAESTIEEAEIISAIPAPPRGSETILLVEDEDAVRALARLILTGAGYTVLEAADGDGAIRLASSHKESIHLLVTDVIMPGAGGRVVAERVAELHSGMRILFLSGYTDDAVIRNGVLRQGAGFLQKPFSPSSLVLKVREVLDMPPEADHL